MGILAVHKEAIISIVFVIVIFSIYLLINGSALIRRMITAEDDRPVSSVRKVILQKLTGLILFGLVPLVILLFIQGRGLTDYGVQSNTVLKGLLFALPFAVIILPLSYLNSKKTDNLKIYPLFRLPVWNWYSLTGSALLWMVYLVAYEFFFRGILLFSCIHSLSIPLAIFINICLYSMAHIPKGIKEAAGSIPLGLVLCLLVIKFGTIWVAVFIHIMMALANEWFSISAHPDMQFQLHKNRTY